MIDTHTTMAEEDHMAKVTLSKATNATWAGNGYGRHAASWNVMHGKTQIGYLTGVRPRQWRLMLNDHGSSWHLTRPTPNTCLLYTSPSPRDS